MALNLVGSSTQYIQNAAPLVTDYAFSVGMWINLAAVATATRTLFCLSDTGTTNNYLEIQMTTTETIALHAAAGGVSSPVSPSGTLTAGAWAFVIGRFISSTNRRIVLLNSTGAVTQNNGTTARAPTGLDTIAIGARVTSAGASQPWDGLIAEYWIASGDAALDSAATMPEATVRQLAYGGPFSVPYLVPRIVEYRSFRTHPTIDDPAETYHRGTPSTWTAVNGPTIGQHPPLPYWYQGTPYNALSMMMV